MAGVIRAGVVFAVLLCSISGLVRAQSEGAGARAALRAAIDTEVVKGDVPGAIAQYRAIVERHARTDRPVVADALLRLGAVYEKLDEIAQARQVFSRLVAEFGDQLDAQAEARRRLEALPPNGSPFKVSVIEGLETLVNRVANLGGYSPDGSLIALGIPSGTGAAAGAALGVREVATGRHRILADRLPALSVYDGYFSQDGRYVAATMQIGNRQEDHSGGAIVVASTAPGEHPPQVVPTITGTNAEMRRYASERWIQDRAILWSPDGRYLPYVTRQEGSRTHDVRLIDAQTRQTRSLGLTVTTWPDFLWSPDGNQIAVRTVDESAGLDEVRLVDLDGRISRTVPLRTPSGVTTRLQAWTTAGALLVQRITSASVSEYQLIDLDAGRIRTTCTGRPETVGLGYLYRPAATDICLSMTPDGASQLVWKQSTRRIVIRDTTTGNERTLTTASADEHYGYLSPDGRTLLFVSNRDGRWALYATNLALAPTPQPVELARFASLPGAVGVSWFRDGFVAHFRTSESNVYRIAVDPETGRSRGQLERLTQDRPDNWYASVSPAGERIVFLSQQNARVGLSIMGADGTNERVISDQLRPGLERAVWRSESELLVKGHSDPGGTGPRPLLSFDVATGAYRELKAIPPATLRSSVYTNFNLNRSTDEIVFVQGQDASGRVSFTARKVSDGAERPFATLDAGDRVLWDFLVINSGRELVYVLDERATPGCKPCELGILNVETGERRALPMPAQLPILVALSPDDRFLLYGWLRPRVMDLRSGESWQLVDEAAQRLPEGVTMTSWGDDAGADWSPNGQYVVLHLSNTRAEWRRWSGVTADAIAKASAAR